jgi:NAD(P)-dependent dehydrogenase (short-subunit alcohol dehydrogenase family)
MDRLKGKTVLVTGAAQGIGAALARGLAAKGAAVVIADILPGEAVAEEIRQQGGQALALNCDVTSAKIIQETIAETLAKFGRLDAVVNNAALFGKVQNISLFDIEVADWDRIMAVNARGPWLLARYAVPAMEQSGGGAIVNIASNRAFIGAPELLHYDASKGAVVAMTRSMARELGTKRIRVNCIAPGLTMSENVKLRAGIEERAPLIRGARPINRDQQPDDLVGAVVFLVSDESSFITGQTLVVDGGNVMH